jgi:hypothetical protein
LLNKLIEIFCDGNKEFPSQCTSPISVIIDFELGSFANPKPKQLDTSNNNNDTFLKYIDKKHKQYNNLARVDEGSYYLNNNLKYPPNNSDRSLMTEIISDQDSQNSSNLNLSSMGLEPTEIDYLRQIIYSYMMGTDPITMAKVIVAVLKFPEDEKRKIIENEKSKFKWFSS